MATLYKVESVILLVQCPRTNPTAEVLVAAMPRDTFGTFDAALEFCISDYTKSEVYFYHSSYRQRLWIYQETALNGVKTIVRFLVRPDGSFKVE